MSIINWARANAQEAMKKQYAKYLAHKTVQPGKHLSGERADQIAAEARWKLEEGLGVEEAIAAALDFYEEWLWCPTAEGRAKARAEAHAAIQDHFEWIKDWPQYRKYFK